MGTQLGLNNREGETATFSGTMHCSLDSLLNHWSSLSLSLSPTRGRRRLELTADNGMICDVVRMHNGCLESPMSAA